MSKLNWWKTAYAVILLCAGAAIAVPAQTFTTLHSFDYRNGAFPFAPPVQATDGNLYGATSSGGNGGPCTSSYGCGTVFKITPSGTLTTLYNFCVQSGCADGATPYGGLAQATDSNLYGTTYFGGSNNGGTVFRITPGGRTLTTLYSFCSVGNCTDGEFPHSALIQASDGTFYGTTVLGGANLGGTVFKITPTGVLTTLYSFCSQSGCTDGSGPYAGLVQGADGNFYGTTSFGGSNDGGTVFRITPSGMLTILYSFCSESNCTDGYEPYGGLVQFTDGSFYGTTYLGGTSVDGSGTVFKITPAGTLTTLDSFGSGGVDGGLPNAGLYIGSDGNFYGTTVTYGAHDSGTVFEVTPSGTVTTLYNFCSQSGCTDGSNPYAGLVQDTDGVFYGTAGEKGASANCSSLGCGTVFSVSVGLGPFVETLPTAGKVGKPVIILGTNLMGATSVTFNGTSAAFRVVSKSAISTSVPVGASTGKVQVVTPAGTLSSNVPFRVAP